MRMPLWVKIGWSIWLIIWAPIYWRQYGLQNFLFFCDLANVLVGVALWLESRLIFSWQATSVFLVQTLYTIDLIGALLTGKHIFGATEYMFDPHIPLFVRLLSLFHVAMIPLLLWAIARLGYDGRGWKVQTVTAWVVVPINYFWRPEMDVNWARGLFFREQHAVPGLVYLFAYLIVVPMVIYYPTHMLLRFWARKTTHA